MIASELANMVFTRFRRDSFSFLMYSAMPQIRMYRSSHPAEHSFKSRSSVSQYQAISQHCTSSRQKK